MRAAGDPLLQGILRHVCAQLLGWQQAGPRSWVAVDRRYHGGLSTC
jgi:hypothetical protein